MAPPKKGTPSAAAPKLKGKKPASKASTTSNAVAPEPTTKKTPSKKDQKKAATAKSAGASATKPKTAPLGRPTLPGETPPDKKAARKPAAGNSAGTSTPAPKVAPYGRPTLPDEIPPPSKKAQRNDAIAKATAAAATKAKATPPKRPASSGDTPQQRANTSRKRRSSSIEDEDEATRATASDSKKRKGATANPKRKATVGADEDDEQEPVATRTATKKVKKDPSGTKRKATTDDNKKPRKVAKIKEEQEQEEDPIDFLDPRRKKAASDAPSSAKKPANSKAKTPTPRAGKVRKTPAKLNTGVQINFAPTQPLDIFIFGSGESGELGLGNKKIDGKKPVNVKRPRIHPFLSADAVGVVQIACGGMHSVALTKDSKIFTWGVNDQGALGRDTTWDGGLRDADAEDDDNGDDFEALNPIECTPAEVSTKNIVNGTKFIKVVASDSASFALTEDGRIYGWGTFRVSFSQAPPLSTSALTPV